MPMGAANPQELLFHLMQADEFGVKLEVVEGEFTWEFFPSPLHQDAINEIQFGIWQSRLANRSGCACYTLPDAYIEFPDGSLKRPDLMVFCERPARIGREPLTVVPEAVVEILSPKGEKKDLVVGPRFYLAQGVKDVVVVDPEGGVVHHFRRDGTRQLGRPSTLRLECGCEMTT